MKNKLNSSVSFNEENVNPMDGVSNMSDAMLVLAVGIMLALVINWKIDIKEVAYNEGEKVEVNEKDMKEFDEATSKQENSVSVEDVEKKFVKAGTVYKDTSTGKTYVVVE